MKKTYQAPTMNIVILKGQMSILAGSDQNVGIGEAYSGGGIGSRSYDAFWDDEEE